MLVVIVIVGLLLGIILVAVGGVFRSARETSVQNTLATVATAAQAFQSDIGALPPLLAYEESSWQIGETPTQAVASNGLIVPSSLQGPSNEAIQVLRRARYGSEYTIGVYLLGAGDLNTRQGDHASAPSPMGEERRNQGGNTDDDDGLAGAGIRAPGPDLSWGGAADRSKQRANKFGRTYGPYLDAARLGDALVVEQETGLFKLHDAWGQPIRYYRDWPVRDSSGNNSSVLRIPVELRTETALARNIEEAEPQMEFETEALNAPFMLLSAGKPVLFRADTSPLPQFGDRRPPPNEGSLTQSLATDFMPDQLPPEQQTEILTALRSNIRVTR